MSSSLRTTWVRPRSRRLEQLSQSLKISFQICATILFAGCATSGHQHTRALLAGNQLALRGEYLEASRQYEAALKEMPESQAAQRNLGMTLVKLGDYTRALEKFKAVYSSYKHDAEVQYFLGEAYRGLREFAEAAKHYQLGLRKSPNDMRLIKALGWTWHKMGQNDWTVNLLTPYLKFNPHDHQLKLILAGAFNSQKKFSETLNLLSFAQKKEFRLSSEDKVSAQAEKALLKSTLADAHRGSGHCDRAEALYRQVLEKRPFFDKALVGFAECALMQKKLTIAKDLLERAVRSNPDAARAHFLLAGLLQSSDLERSRFYYARFLKLAEGSDSQFTEELMTARQAILRLSQHSGLSR